MGGASGYKQTCGFPGSSGPVTSCPFCLCFIGASASTEILLCAHGSGYTKGE